MSKRIDDYKIVYSAISHEAEREVLALLREGWKLNGGLSISLFEGDILFAQSLVMETNEQ